MMPQAQDMNMLSRINDLEALTATQREQINYLSERIEQLERMVGCAPPPQADRQMTATEVRSTR